MLTAAYSANVAVFNSVFTDKKKSSSQEVIEYQAPQPFYMEQQLSHSVLGEGNISDFSGDTDSLQYTDYRKAHTKTTLINPDSVKYTTYKNVEQLEESRSNVRHQMNEEEEREYQLRLAKEKEEEQQRQWRLQNRDQLVSRQHDKINQLMLDHNIR